MRIGLNSVLINNKIFYFAGDRHEVFYLDLLNSLNTSYTEWVSVADSPISIKYSTSVVNINDSTVFLIGGLMKNPYTGDDDYSHFVYNFDSKNLKWGTPQIKGDLPYGLKRMQAVIDNSGLIYIFGGNKPLNSSINDDIKMWYNDMNILNIINMTWITLNISLNNIPPKRSDYSATLLSNGFIVYIGGRFDPSEPVITSNLNEKTQGAQIDIRSYHSDVLSEITNANSSPTNTNKNIYLLDIQTFTWSMLKNNNSSNVDFYNQNDNYLLIVLYVEIEENSHRNQSNKKNPPPTPNPIAKAVTLVTVGSVVIVGGI
ncbi:4092_t:CDS:2 [Diversispora eburnea]|uniref:4092_t:CDS:1 n=1 Tax=Diversispora eburnea TaxID=1213867 RepID=A0A9N8ZTQ4_9GLOM|nr:4092_t:CDS:2 [Diversispora eburnea]